MKLVFFGESPADQAVIAEFTKGILGQPFENLDLSLEGHGWPSVLQTLPAVIAHVYYRTDADEIVVVVDADDSPIHDTTMPTESDCHPECRYCQLRKKAHLAHSKLSKVEGRNPPKIAIGIAVPAIEAWLQVGINHEVGEARWKIGMKENNRPFTRRKLKELVYGSDHPSIEIELNRGSEEATRIVTEKKPIEIDFPTGFGLMANEIRSWLS